MLEGAAVIGQECPDEVLDNSSINLRKLVMLPGDSLVISQACSFVLCKLMHHGHIIKGIAFLRNEPLLCNSRIMQSITDLVCSAGLIHETKERLGNSRDVRPVFTNQPSSPHILALE